jgi:hypothetical protein
MSLLIYLDDARIAPGAYAVISFQQEHCAAMEEGSMDAHKSFFLNRSRLSLLAFCAVWFGSGPIALADDIRTVHVENYGNDNQSCGQRANPCRSITRAIARANEGEIIWVGPGRYGDLNDNGDFDDPGDDRSVAVIKRLTILSTHGAAATVIDFAGSGIGVNISADGAVFGRKHHGFTIMRSHVGLFVDRAANVRVAGNIALNNTLDPPGAIVSGMAFFFDIGNGPIYVTDNTARGSYYGFYSRGDTAGTMHLRDNTAMDNIEGFLVTGTSRHSVIGNVASANETGFDIQGTGQLVRNNISASNRFDGFIIFGTSHTLRRNSAAGNLNAGFTSYGTSITLVENNIIGNQGTPPNCGVINAGQPLNARNNFWGTAAGPGPCYPASEVVPFATEPFTIKLR